jgi:DNA-binding GntR family transcriptional regulator
LYTVFRIQSFAMPLDRLIAEPDLVERVYASLLASIANGDLAPGTRLTQEELAERLDVSRQPVLQALRLLKKDGFVVDAGKRGLMVRPLDSMQIAQVYELRAALDALAARLAAQRKAALDDALIAHGRKAARSPGVGPLIEADITFHNAIYAASGNPMIAESANRHWAHIRRAMGAVLQTAGLRENIWDEHQAITEAIRVGDAPRAERLAREHGESAARTLVHRLLAHSAAA